MDDNFIKDRNEAFISGDEEKIKAYCEKYGIEIPENEEIFWAGVHKSICNLFLVESNGITIEQYDKSYNWLIDHGYTPTIFGDTGGDE